MFKVLAELLMAREVEFEQGEVKIFKTRFMMVPADILAAFTKEIMQDEQKTKWLYQTTKQIFKARFAGEVRKRYALDKKKLFDWIASIAEIAGYGKIQIVDYDEKNMRGIARIYNSAICSELKPSTKATGHMFRGMTAAVAEAAYNAEGDCIETKCIAKGDPYCEFIVRLRSEFEKEHASLINEQVPLNESGKPQ